MKLKIVQINCLDLFVFIDQKIDKKIEDLTEEEWQSLTYSQKGNKPLDKIKKLAETLLKTKADIILLNEVGGQESLENFNQYFLKNKYHVAISEGSKRGIDTGFLIKKGIAFDFKDYKKVKLIHSDEKFRFSRSVNQLTVKSKGKDVLNIFGVHLKSKRGDGNDSDIIEIRYREVQGLVKIMKKVRKTTKLPYILCGDFNGPAGEKDHEFEFDSLYEKTSLKDIHDLNNSSAEDRYSFVRLLRGGKTEYVQIDYIMLSKDLHSSYRKPKRWMYRENQKDIYVVTGTEKEKLPSDHYPQSVVIKV